MKAIIYFGQARAHDLINDEVVVFQKECDLPFVPHVEMDWKIGGFEVTVRRVIWNHDKQMLAVKLEDLDTQGADTPEEILAFFERIGFILAGVNCCAGSDWDLFFGPLERGQVPSALHNAPRTP